MRARPVDRPERSYCRWPENTSQPVCLSADETKRTKKASGRGQSSISSAVAPGQFGEEENGIDFLLQWWALRQGCRPAGRLTETIYQQWILKDSTRRKMKTHLEVLLRHLVVYACDYDTGRDPREGLRWCTTGRATRASSGTRASVSIMHPLLVSGSRGRSLCGKSAWTVTHDAPENVTYSIRNSVAFTSHSPALPSLVGRAA